MIGLWRSTIGKKAIMAVTGVILFGFVIGHMLGNLQVFLGPERINAYGKMLHDNAALLWTARIVLLVALVFHIITSVQLVARNKAARPVPYEAQRYRAASYASRTMLWSGLLVAAFVVYHILHLTTGDAHPDKFRMLEGSKHAMDVYYNVTTGFRVWYITLAYVVAQVLLGLHLSHGAWSFFQSLGVNHPRYTPLLRLAGRGLAFIVVAGNMIVPLAVLAGLVK
jgi:succinate dehydrogenase / fumarate reductase, cytochrome b subunit